MDVERELKRLRRIVRLQGLAIVLALLWTVGAWAIGRLTASLTGVRVVRDGNAIRIASISDGPYIVTHLAVLGRDAGGEENKRTATLPEPSACIDSGGLRIEDITKLEWRDVTGELASPPDASMPITALLIWPEEVEQRKTAD